MFLFTTLIFSPSSVQVQFPSGTINVCKDVMLRGRLRRGVIHLQADGGDVYFCLNLKSIMQMLRVMTSSRILGIVTRVLYYGC